MLIWHDKPERRNTDDQLFHTGSLYFLWVLTALYLSFLGDSRFECTRAQTILNILSFIHLLDSEVRSFVTTCPHDCPTVIQLSGVAALSVFSSAYVPYVLSHPSY